MTGPVPDPGAETLGRCDAEGWLQGVPRLPSRNQDERPPGAQVSLLVVHAISLSPGRFGGDGIERLFTNTLAPSRVENSDLSESELALLRKFPPAAYSHYPSSLQIVADLYRKRYEESVRFVDSELAKFTHFLEANSLSEKLLYLFTSDHGESFERGYMNHGEALYESSTRVPLIVKFPSQNKGAKIPGSVQLSDIAPTVLRVANIAIPAWMDGQSLEPDRQPVARESISLNFKHPIGQTHYPLPTQVAIWWKHYKLIVACDGVRAELYNLDEDPDEAVNLSVREPAVVRNSRADLNRDWSSRCGSQGCRARSMAEREGAFTSFAGRRLA